MFQSFLVPVALCSPFTLRASKAFACDRLPSPRRVLYRAAVHPLLVVLRVFVVEVDHGSANSKHAHERKTRGRPDSGTRLLVTPNKRWSTHPCTSEPETRVISLREEVTQTLLKTQASGLVVSFSCYGLYDPAIRIRYPRCLSVEMIVYVSTSRLLGWVRCTIYSSNSIVPPVWKVC